MEPKISEKAWNPELEKNILKKWEDDKIYDFTPQEDNFTIDTPPPYPSGRPWHIGAAAHYSQIDMIARTARMAGKNVYFPIGIDRNGLPVELYTEKKYKIRMRETDRGEFLNLCREALDDLEAEMILIMKNLGNKWRLLQTTTELIQKNTEHLHNQHSLNYGKKVKCILQTDLTITIGYLEQLLLMQKSHTKICKLN